jgi:hypothetical protein
VGVAGFAMAAPALADEAKHSPPPPCGAAPPLTTPCSATVTPPAAPGGTYSVVLPGIGTLNFTIDPTTNMVTSATVSGLAANFTASTPKVDGDGDKVSVTFTNTTDPSQVYRLSVGVKPPTTPGGSPTFNAKVKGAHKHSESGEKEHEHEGGSSGGSGSGEHD